MIALSLGHRARRDRQRRDHQRHGRDRPDPVRPRQTSLEVPSYRVGTNVATPVSVTPFSRFDVPPGLGGSVSGGAATVSANGIGAPLDVRLQLTRRRTATAPRRSPLTRALRPAATDRRCDTGSSVRGAPARRGSGIRRDVHGPRGRRRYRFTACVESWYDDESFGRSTATASVRAQQSGRAPRGWTFAVARRPTSRSRVPSG